MANLTWRDVEAPNFRSSMDGFRQASSLLNDAFGSARAGLRDYENISTDRINNNILMELAKIQDVDKAKSAATDLLSGVDPRKVNATTLAALMARPTDVIRQNAAEGDLDWSKYTRGRITDENTALDAARTDAAKFITAAMNGDDKGAMSIFSQSPTLQALGPDKLISVATSGQNLTKGNEDILGSRQDRDLAMRQEGRTAQSFADQQSDRAAMLEAEQIASAALQGGGGTAEGTRSSFMSALGNASPRARFLAMGLVNQNMRAGIFGPDEMSAYSGGGGGAISGGGDPTRIITGGGAGNLGIGQLPDHVQTQGQAVEFGKSLNRRGQASSAMGLYQITQSTREEFGQAALGKNWRNAPINAQTDDAIAQKIFESTGGNPTKLKGRWEALKRYSDAQVAEMARGGWTNIRQVIAKGESGGDAAALLGMDAETRRGVTTVINTNLAARNMQNQTGVGNNRYAKALSDDALPVEVAHRLRAGVFKNVPVNFLMDQIQRIMQEGDVNAAVAGEILTKNLQSGRRKDWFFSGMTPRLGNGMTLNDAGIEADIKAARDNTLYSSIANNQGVVHSAQDIEASTNNFNAALARWNAVQNRYATGGMSKDNFTREAQKYLKVQQSHENLLKQIGGDESRRPAGRPEPEQSWAQRLFGSGIRKRSPNEP